MRYRKEVRGIETYIHFPCSDRHFSLVIISPSVGSEALFIMVDKDFLLSKQKEFLAIVYDVF